MTTVNIEYYALFREQSGKNKETFTTQAGTVDQLYEELKQQYGFSLNAAQLRVALNEEFSEWNSPIKEGDSIVFIPPVAGG